MITGSLKSSRLNPGAPITSSNFAYLSFTESALADAEQAGSTVAPVPAINEVERKRLRSRFIVVNQTKSNAIEFNRFVEDPTNQTIIPARILEFVTCFKPW